MANLKCANCGGDHAASYSECKIFKKVSTKANTGKFQRAPRLQTGADTNRGQNFTEANNPWVRFNKGRTTNQRTGSTSANPNTASQENSSIFDIIKKLFCNMNWTRILNIVKDTALKVNEAPDGLSKSAIIINGIVEIFK